MKRIIKFKRSFEYDFSQILPKFPRAKPFYFISISTIAAMSIKNDKINKRTLILIFPIIPPKLLFKFKKENE